MITVIDQITYLPKSANDLKSQIHNVAAKGTLDLIKKKLSQVITNGKSAKVIIAGRVSKSGAPFQMNMQITQCNDDELQQRIKKALGISNTQ